MEEEDLRSIIAEFPELLNHRNGKCAKCGCTYMPHLSRHHIFPDQYFPGNDFIITLCRNGRNGCHNRIEREIQRAEKLCGGKLSPLSYCILAERFLADKEPASGKRKKDPYFNRPQILNRPVDIHFNGVVR
jgi:hypothetical protein